MILFFLLALVGYTSDQCNVCAWPYVGTANQRGQCVLGVGLQSNVQGSCQLYCQTWGNSVAGQTSSNHVASSDENGTCICQRTNSGVMQYLSRPRKSCDSWGPSDDYIASNSSSAYSIKSSQISVDEDKYYESRSTNDNVFSSSMSYALGTMDQSYVNEFYQVTNPVNGTIRFTAGNNPSLGVTRSSLSLDLSSITSRIGMSQDLLLRSLNASATARSFSTDSLLQIIDSSLNQLSNSTSGLLTNSDFMQAKQDIVYAINSHVGGGVSTSSPTDLSPVLSAISSAQDANAASFASLGRQFTALGNDVNSGLSTMSVSLSRMGDSVSSLGNHIHYMGDMIDSGANARWKSDRAHADSLSSAAGDSGRKYRGISDSLAKGGGGGWGSDSLAAFNSGLSGTNNNLGLIQSEFASLKETLNSGSCDEFPSWGYDVWGHFYDIGAIFNQFPAIFSVMRFLGRFVGAFLGFKTIASALGAKKDS